MNIEKLKEQYLQEQSAQGKASNTLNTYDFVLKSFSSYLKGNQKQGIGRQEYVGYLNNLKKKGRQTTTIATHSVIIKAFYKWMYDEKQNSFNPSVLKIHKAKPPEIPEISKADIERIIGGVKGNTITRKRDRAMLLLLSTSGVRASELCSLNRDSVRMDDDGIFSMSIRGKGNKDRTAYTTQQCYNAIQVYLSSRKDYNDAMFMTHTHTEQRIDRQTVHRVVKYYAIKAGLDVSPHDIRHYVATELLRQGLNLTKVQNILGHSLIQTTSRYSHLSHKDIGTAFRNAMDR